MSAGSSLNGSIDAPGGLRVEGRLQGDVRVQGALEVLKEASIIGTEVHCRDLLVAGLIEANVYAAGSVTIVAGGRVHGDLHCRDLQAPRGAQLQGRITLGEPPAETRPPGRQSSDPAVEARVAAVDASA
ncbi:MAG: polymer-forming cytoskeletal protein [Cyanobacteriota bacterium]